jgi:hypothetical protein
MSNVDSNMPISIDRRCAVFSSAVGAGRRCRLGFVSFNFVCSFLAVVAVPHRLLERTACPARRTPPRENATLAPVRPPLAERPQTRGAVAPTLVRSVVVGRQTVDGPSIQWSANRPHSG